MDYSHLNSAMIATFGEVATVHTRTVSAAEIKAIYRAPYTGKDSRDRTLMQSVSPQDHTFHVRTEIIEALGIEAGAKIHYRGQDYAIVQPPQPDSLGDTGLAVLICSPA